MSLALVLPGFFYREQEVIFSPPTEQQPTMSLLRPGVGIKPGFFTLSQERTTIIFFTVTGDGEDFGLFSFDTFAKATLQVIRQGDRQPVNVKLLSAPRAFNPSTFSVKELYFDHVADVENGETVNLQLSSFPRISLHNEHPNSRVLLTSDNCLRIVGSRPAPVSYYKLLFYNSTDVTLRDFVTPLGFLCLVALVTWSLWQRWEHPSSSKPIKPEARWWGRGLAVVCLGMLWWSFNDFVDREGVATALKFGRGVLVCGFFGWGIGLAVWAERIIGRQGETEEDRKRREAVAAEKKQRDEELSREKVEQSRREEAEHKAAAAAAEAKRKREAIENPASETPPSERRAQDYISRRKLDAKVGAYDKHEHQTLSEIAAAEALQHSIETIEKNPNLTRQQKQDLITRAKRRYEDGEPGSDIFKD